MIHFYDKKRDVVMLLSDFFLENVCEPQIGFSADISYSIYKASRKIIVVTPLS